MLYPLLPLCELPRAPILSQLRSPPRVFAVRRGWQQFRFPIGISVCLNGDFPEIYVADSGNHVIRRIRRQSTWYEGAPLWPTNTDDIVVDTVSGEAGFPGTNDTQTRLERPRASVLTTTVLRARFALPKGVGCFGSTGGLIVGDTFNHRIRQAWQRNGNVTAM